jgi:hypothetical protein
MYEMEAAKMEVDPATTTIVDEGVLLLLLLF